MQVLFKELSKNHEITVYETSELYGEKGNFRVLQFSNEAIQGAMDMNTPNRILFEYPRAIIHLLEVNNPIFEDVFVIGHGIGTIAGHFAEKSFKVAELDHTVVALSKRYLGYDMDNVIIGDGRAILGSEVPSQYDYIVLDAFTEKGTPQHLISKQFFRIARDKLDAQGSIIMNLMGRVGNDRLINAIHTTLKEEFSYTKSFALPAAHSSDIQNIILIARNQPISFQLRNMAGFTEIEPGEGHIIQDSTEK